MGVGVTIWQKHHNISVLGRTELIYKPVDQNMLSVVKAWLHGNTDDGCPHAKTEHEHKCQHPAGDRNKDHIPDLLHHGSTDLFLFLIKTKSFASSHKTSFHHASSMHDIIGNLAHA